MHQGAASMNDDLLISIGADLSNFNAAMTNAQASFKTLQNTIKNQSATKLSINIGPVVSELKKAEDAFNKYRNTLIKKTRIQLDISADDKAGIRQVERLVDVAIDGQTKINNNAKLQAEKTSNAIKSFTKDNQDYANRIGAEKYDKEKVEAKKLSDAIKSFTKDNADYDRKLAAENYNKKRKLETDLAAANKRVSQTNARNALNNQRILVQSSARASLKAQKERALQEKRIQDIAIKSKRATYDRILRIKHLTDRREIASEYIKLRKMSHKQLREYEAVEAKKTSIYQKQAAKRNADSAVGRGFLDSVQVVAKYGAISQALYGIQTSFGSVIAEVARFDNSIKKTAAVLGYTNTEALPLARTIVDVGKKYGQSFEEIEEGLLTIGRAGIDNIKNLKNTTEGLAALSLITGDAMRHGAAAVASLLAVYPELADATQLVVDSQGNLITQSEDLINKMGAVANATRLGLEDFSTISNYALTTATSVGLTSDAYLALAGSLSKVGLNASTIGTSIRRLNKFTDDGSQAVQRFFNVVGKSQKQFKNDLKTNEHEMGIFAARLAQMTDSQFVNATKELNIQLKATATSLRKIGQNNEFLNMMIQVEEAKSVLEQAGYAAEGLTTRWNRAVNTLKSSMNLAVSAIIIEIERVLNSAGKDGPSAFESFAKGVEAFGVIALKVIAIVATGVASLIALINLGLSGFNKLAGKVDKDVGSILGGVTTAEYDRAKELLDLKQDIYDADNANAKATGKNNFEKGTAQLLELNRLKTMIATYEDGTSVIQKFTRQGENEELLGDKDVAAAKQMVKAISDLGDGALKGLGTYAEVMEKIGDANARAKTDAKYDPQTGGYIEDGLAVKETAAMVKARKEAEIYGKVLEGTMTYQEGQIAKITLQIDAQAAAYNKLAAMADADVYSVKGKEDALKAEAQLLELIFRKQQLLRKEQESGGSNDSRQRIQLLKLEGELATVKFEYNMASQGLLLTQNEQDAISLAIAKEKTENALGVFEAAKLEATDAKGRVALGRAELTLWKAKRDQAKLVNKDALKFAKQMKSVGDSFADALLSGDMEKAFKGLFKDITKVFTDPLKDSFSTLFGNTMKETMGSFYESMTDSVGDFASTAVKENAKAGQAAAKTGVVEQAKGDPYTAWIRMAAMAATMAALGFAVGSIGGGSGKLSQEQIDNAKGQDASDYSDLAILSDLVDAYQDVQYPMLEVTYKMYKHLRNMDKNFYSIASAISGKTGAVGVDITGGSFAGGIYDGSFYSTKTKDLLASGLAFKDQTLGAMSSLSDIYVQGYEYVKTVKDYWWKTSITYNTTKFDLPADTVNDFAKAFKNGYELLFTSGVLLGMDAVDLSTALTNATINLGDENGLINLEGLDAQGVADAIDGVFSVAFSQVVDQIPFFTALISRYSTGLEESIDTLTRISLEYDQAAFSFGLIGKDFTDVITTTTLLFTQTTSTWADKSIAIWRNWGSWFNSTADKWVTTTETWTEVIEDAYTAQMQILDIVASAGGLEAFQDAMSAFMSNFYTDAEQLGFMTKALQQSFDTLGIAMPETNDEFRNLLETMDTGTEEGAYLYGQVLLLAESFATMTDAADGLAEGLAEGIAEALDISGIRAISDAWLSELSYLTNAQKTAYADGYYDIIKDLQAINDEVSLVDAARSVAETTFKTATTREEYIPAFDRYIAALEDEVTDATLQDVVVKLDEVVDSIRELENTTIRITA